MEAISALLKEQIFMNPTSHLNGLYKTIMVVKATKAFRNYASYSKLK